MDRANDVWIEELRQHDLRREAALADFRTVFSAACAAHWRDVAGWTMPSWKTLCKRRS